MAKSVCIIGAGVAGISALKSALEEGLLPTCFESRCDIGGIWYYRPHEKTGRGRAYQSLITNVSKEASCFSDFPYPKEFPPYMSHTKLLEYLKSYVAHFDLEKHIFCGRTVTHVEPTKTGGLHKWRVTTRSTSSDSDEHEEKYFDGLIICSGVNFASRLPEIEGMLTTFQGKVMHSCDYNSPDEFNGKRVLIIGLGNSGADITVDISRRTERPILSSRSGGWIIPRMFQNGLPPDMTVTTRLRSFVRSCLPQWIVDWYGKTLFNSKINHDFIGLRSKYGPLDPNASIMINDELPARIMSGNVIVRPDVARFTENEVIFIDGRKEEIDCVICATGYDTKFPFISDDILPDCRSELKLFEWIFPFQYEYPECIAVVGILPMTGGSVLPSFECQARYVAQVMAGITKLPSVASMVENYKFLMSELPGGRISSRFHKNLGVNYHDRVAKRGGFYPDFWKIFFRNPILAIRLHVGPFLSYHYRLRGRHPWAGATERILNAIPNTLYAISNPGDVQTYST